MIRKKGLETAQGHLAKDNLQNKTVVAGGGFLSLIKFEEEKILTIL